MFGVKGLGFGVWEVSLCMREVSKPFKVFRFEGRPKVRSCKRNQIRSHKGIPYVLRASGKDSRARCWATGGEASRLYGGSLNVARSRTLVEACFGHTFCLLQGLWCWVLNTT